VRTSANYNYSFEPLYIEPFKNADSLNSKYFQFIKDLNVNLLPSTISVNSNIIRRYNEQLSRSLIEGLPELPVLRQRHFMFDWDYAIGYNLTKSLQFNFRATNNNIYDDFFATDDIKLFDNFFTVGRPDHYHQSLNGTYKIPLNKIPFLEFVNADYAYTADFDWQASSQSYVDKVGNVIQNANTHILGFDLDFNKFYKTVGIDKLLNNKSKVGETNPTAAETAEINSAKKNKSVGSEIGQTFYNGLIILKIMELSCRAMCLKSDFWAATIIAAGLRQHLVLYSEAKLTSDKEPLKMAGYCRET